MNHAKRVGLAGKMASCRDKEKTKLKFLRSYFSSAMPHDSIGEFPMTEFVLKNVGVESREKMSDLKLYTDTLGARTGTGNDVLSKKRKGLAVDDATDRATFLEFCEAVARACDLFTIEFDASLGGVDLAHLPPLSRQLEVFLPAFVDGFGKDFWNDNRIINYDKAMTAKHAPYNKRYNKFGPGPDFRRVELNPDDTRHNSDYFRKFHIQIRVLHAVVRLPKILEERTNERDKKILDKMKLAEKQAVQESLKAQAMARKAQR